MIINLDITAHMCDVEFELTEMLEQKIKDFLSEHMRLQICCKTSLTH